MFLKHKLLPEPQTSSTKCVKLSAEPHLDCRREKREAFYRELQAKHQEIETMMHEDARSKALRDYEEIRKDRRRREFKAKPVRQYSCVTSAIERVFKPTVPVGPRLHTATRARGKHTVSGSNMY
jgi:hypothetical protein